MNQNRCEWCRYAPPESLRFGVNCTKTGQFMRRIDSCDLFEREPRADDDYGEVSELAKDGE